MATTEKAQSTGDALTAAILDAGPDCVMALDQAWRVLAANRAAERMLGVSAGALPGVELRELVRPRDLHASTADRSSHRLRAAVGQWIDVETRANRRDPLRAELRITPTALAGGPAFVAHLRDVTEARRAEEALLVVAEEQAALRRVAMSVASEEDLQRVACVVTQEVGRLLGAHTANMVRYDDGPTATVVGGWSADDVPNVEVGSTIPLDGETTASEVRRTGRPARVDSYDSMRGELAERLRRLGFRCAVGAPVMVSGRLWGAVMVSSVEREPFPPGSEQRIAGFCELVAQALANADAREQLAASRARIVQAGDNERRRLERNLHDGAQQRLVALSILLKLAERQLSPDAHDVRSRLVDAAEELNQALAELRELARGLHPAVLTQRGLEAALGVLAARVPVPVEIDVSLAERLPESVEAAAYYLVAEALTNVAKYARADQAHIRITHRNELVEVVVADDGIGGADATHGSGLRGLADRIEALRGHLEVRSVSGKGTTVRATIPVPIRP